MAIQTAIRGNADRTRVQHMKRACGNYRINKQAEHFGECICGWPKEAHEVPGPGSTSSSPLLQSPLLS